MKEIVTQSASRSSTDNLPILPFLLNNRTENEPSFFEVVFFINNIRYRYGFEATSQAVISEWLFSKTKNKEILLFIRDRQILQIDKSFKEGFDLEPKTRANALFLSVADQFNGQISKTIIEWFKKSGTYSGLKHDSYRTTSLKLLKEDKLKPLLLDFLKYLNLGFDDIEVLKGLPEQESILDSSLNSIINLFPNLLSDNAIDLVKTHHSQYNDNGDLVGVKKFEMLSQESSGTNKVFDLAGIIITSIVTNSLSVIDELDSKLHPILTLALSSMYHSMMDDYKNAQLIFATHDTNLLSFGKFRRDQIYFVEKDKFGASDLYSLAEYKEASGAKVRKDRSFEKDYIQGRYGAIPFLGEFKL